MPPQHNNIVDLPGHILCVWVYEIGCSVIFLPLRPASLKEKKSPKTQNNLLYASHEMQRSIDRSEDVFVECPVCVIYSSQGRADMKDQDWKG